MPYIVQDVRDDLAGIIGAADEAFTPETSVGDMNYVITRLMQIFMLNRGGVNYTNINNLVGVLDCAKMELYRRLGATYEDQKIKENGDVY